MLDENNPYAVHLKEKKTHNKTTDLSSVLHLYKLARHCKDPVGYRSSGAAQHVRVSYAQSSLHGFKQVFTN